MSDERISKSVENLDAAYLTLVRYLGMPVRNDRDEAGVIQSFEYTYELFWKTFQKIAALKGIVANSPKDAMRAALQLGLILPDDEATWLDMLDARNLASHTYRRETAHKVFVAIQSEFCGVMGETLGRIKSGPG